MRKLINRLAVASLVGLPIVAGAATTAAASTNAPGIRTSSSGASASPRVVFAFAGPKSKIVGQGATAKYKPTAFTMAEDTSGNDCSPFLDEAELANKGTQNAYITIDGSPFTTLAAHSKTFICAYGYGGGTQFTLNLTNKKGTKVYSSTLTITTSD
jgi:hypothetical protein